MPVFLTDALSVLQALTNNNLLHLAKALQILNNNCRVALQWIPALCGVHGNLQADKFSKEGAQKEQPGELPREGHHYQSAYDIKSKEGCLPPS